MYVVKQQEINQLRDKLSDVLHHHGYCLIKPVDLSEKTFLTIAENFGNIQCHERSKENGIVDVMAKQAESKEGYHSTTFSEVYPHTDGSYLDGIINMDRFYHYACPPKLLLLQKISGLSEQLKDGATYLVDGNKLYQDIQKYHPELMDLSISYLRKDQHVIERKIFFRQTDKRIYLNFRYDKTAYVRKKDQALVDFFLHHYLLNEVYHIYPELNEGDILLFDNRKMLHARTKIESNRVRYLRRLWIADNYLTEQMICPVNNDYSNAFTSIYNPYKIIINDSEHITIKPGIRK